MDNTNKIPQFVPVKTSKISELMKNYTDKEVIKAAYNYLYSYDFLLLNKKPRLDMRYNFSKDVLSKINSIKNTIDKRAILLKRKNRSLNKSPQFKNVLSAPLVEDYKANKSDLKHISSNALHFYGRNHWAKNSFDNKILTILAKNRTVSR